MMLKATGKKGVPQGGVITLHKVISNLRGWCRGWRSIRPELDGRRKKTICLWRLARSTKASKALGTNFQKSLRNVAAQCCVAETMQRMSPAVRPVGTSSIPLPGRSDSSRRTGRSFGSCGTDYAQALCGNSPPSAGYHQKQWPDHRSYVAPALAAFLGTQRA